MERRKEHFLFPAQMTLFPPILNGEAKEREGERAEESTTAGEGESEYCLFPDQITLLPRS